MVTEGGEVSFVQRMIRESIITTKKVLWWTCMLGKLSSAVQLANELKVLSGEGKLGGWGVHELKTGGGKTKRWVIMWTRTKLRIRDALARDDLPSSLEKCRPASTGRSGRKLKLGPGWTRKEVLETTTGILAELDGCIVSPSAYLAQTQVYGQQRNTLRALSDPSLRAEDRRKTGNDAGNLDVILTQESWTRRARRAKLQAATSAPSQPRGALSDQEAEPLLMIRVAFHETNDSGETGLVVKMNWTYGADAVKFESFAMFLLGAIERKLEQATSTRSDDSEVQR